MHIFNAFFKVTKKSASWLLIYAGVYVVLCVLISSLVKDPDVGYSDTKLNVVVFDDDNTEESRALTAFIGSRHNIVDPGTRDPEILQDKLYYQVIYYVLTINKGYGEGLLNGETEGLLTYAVDPKSYYAEYLNMQLRQYVSTASLYIKSGMSGSEACEATAENLTKETKVTVPDFGKGEERGLPQKFYLFSLYMAYTIPAIMICVLSRIIISFKKKDIAARIGCSPVSGVKRNLQIILASVIFCIALWLLMTIISFVLSGFPPIGERELLTMLNVFVFTLVSASISVFASTLCNDGSEVIDILGNVLTLGMAFLGGVFVQQSLLSETVLSVAKFLPTYWYVKAINTIGEISGEIFSNTEIFTCIGIEALFAVALFAASIAAAKIKKSR